MKTVASNAQSGTCRDCVACEAVAIAVTLMLDVEGIFS
jgi:hypothetical protein